MIETIAPERQKIGTTLKRGAVKVAGVGIDKMLKGTHSIGVGVLKRDGAPQTADLLKRILPLDLGPESAIAPSLAIRLGHAAIVAGAVITSRKMGPDILEQVSGGINQILGPGIARR